MIGSDTYTYNVVLKIDEAGRYLVKCIVRNEQFPHADHTDMDIRIVDPPNRPMINTKIILTNGTEINNPEVLSCLVFKIYSIVFFLSL